MSGGAQVSPQLMLCLSQTTGYAIKALGCLTAPGAPSQLIADVARCTGVPRAYLAKIFNSLARQGLVTARRGYRGGVVLARPAAEISLLAIVEAVEGKTWLGPCLLAIDECAYGHGCPTHEFWMEICEQIREKLGSTSLADVIAAGTRPPRSGSGARHRRPRAVPAASRPAVPRRPSARQPASRHG
jgi:Rrf2 family protein